MKLISIGAILATSGAFLGFPATTAPALVGPTSLPPQPVATGTGGDVVAVARAMDGMFYIMGSVNGHPVRFLVDTGASTVLLTRWDAMRVGLTAADNGMVGEIRTAGGRATVTWTRASTISIGGQNIRNLPVGVTDTGLPVSLLGQSALAELGPMTFGGDRLTVHSRDSAPPIG